MNSPSRTAPLKNPASRASRNDMPILDFRSKDTCTFFGFVPVPNTSGYRSRPTRIFVNASVRDLAYASLAPARVM
jgi:hypothetical protein